MATKMKTVFYCQGCGYESSNGWDSAPDAENGIHLLKKL